MFRLRGANLPTECAAVVVDVVIRVVARLGARALAPGLTSTWAGSAETSRRPRSRRCQVDTAAAWLCFGLGQVGRAGNGLGSPRAWWRAGVRLEYGDALGRRRCRCGLLPPYRGEPGTPSATPVTYDSAPGQQDKTAKQHGRRAYPHDADQPCGDSGHHSDRRHEQNDECTTTTSGRRNGSVVSPGPR